MNRKNFYPILGLTFLSFLIVLFFVGNLKQYANQEETPAFLTYISGTGIVEPVSGNIMISAPFSRTVEKINVAVNDQVKKGEILFQLYNEDLKANLTSKQKKYEESLSNLDKLKGLPRREDFIIAQENLNKARAVFSQARMEYMSKCCAGSKRAKCACAYTYQEAVADFLVAKTEFEKVKCGAWQPELNMAQFESEQAKAEVEAMEAELEQTYIRAPIDGTLLQVKVHEGEFLEQGKPVIILGNVEELNLRVSIDQFNESRFQPNSPAMAFKQGDPTKECPLKFLHVEPLMVPKKYLTNDLNEKIDTQTFEIIYRIEKRNCYLLIGEQLDVCIYEKEAPHPQSQP